MSAFRLLKAYALGHNTDTSMTAEQLKAASVPVSDTACRDCADPCDEGECCQLLREQHTPMLSSPGHDEFPKFDVDMETEMLGSMKPFARQVRTRLPLPLGTL